MLLTKNVPDER